MEKKLEKEKKEKKATFFPSGRDRARTLRESGKKGREGPGLRLLCLMRKSYKKGNERGMNARSLLIDRLSSKSEGKKERS